MTTEIVIKEKLKLRKPILIEGLPGVGNVGRVSAGYLVNELKMKKFAELYSTDFLPLVILHESLTHMLKCEFYYYRGKDNDFIVLTGDTQSANSRGHYDLCKTVLEFAKSIGVSAIITLGGFVEGKMVEKPKVIGAVNKIALIPKYEKYEIDFKDHSVGTILGTTGLLVGLAERYDIDALCLMGQTMGYPMITDPKAADSVLHILKNMFSLDIDLTKIHKIVDEMEEKLKKTQEAYDKMAKDAKTNDDVKYIG
ncbi:MAG: proteasome assembly chaperone family protein [Candidatus Aenigmarchaeota archaeon]|nr:proteasome assembly chaperone family protein [Candidatus Aenigmarchaeota archaeon]